MVSKVSLFFITGSAKVNIYIYIAQRSNSNTVGFNFQTYIYIFVVVKVYVRWMWHMNTCLPQELYILYLKIKKNMSVTENKVTFFL